LTVVLLKFIFSLAYIIVLKWFFCWTL